MATVAAIPLPCAALDDSPLITVIAPSWGEGWSLSRLRLGDVFWCDAADEFDD